MAQVAYSDPAYSRPAYPGVTAREAARRTGAARDADRANPYAAAAPTRAPYPGAMRRARRRARLATAASLAAAALAGWAVLTAGPGRDAAPAGTGSVLAAAAPAAAPRQSLAWMLDPAPALGAGAAALGRAAPPVPAFRLATLRAEPVGGPLAGLLPGPSTDPLSDPPAEPAPGLREVARRVAEGVAAGNLAARSIGKPGATPVGPVRVAALDPTPAAVSPTAVSPASAPAPSLVPLPVARPPELRAEPRRAAPRVAARALPRTRDVFRAAMAEEPSFLEKLFGVGAAAPDAPREAPRQALAYAGPDAPSQEAPRARLSPSPFPSPAPQASPSAGTAVYDITARTVTLPSGEVLEAHSGLGAYMDDPRYVHLRMRGSTPPATYELTERERLFHGVRAIRLNPVGGSGAIHGRDGLLAHTYMLRQPGASNGCVSFRDYDRFLQAYLRGEIRRLVVVGGRDDSFLGRIGLGDRPGRRG